MSYVENGWFHEVHSYMDLGLSLAVKIEEVLYQERSSYQQIQVFKSTKYGNMLVLDGLIQCTEWDEFAYQEMIANLPLYSHPNPAKVLIIGGGDGGVLREVTKHPLVEQIVLCELDEKVIEVSKKYLPGMSAGFSDPRVTVHIEEGTKFLQHTTDCFDIIINDCTDPVGPGLSLYSKQFYEDVHRALTCEGVICAQGQTSSLVQISTDVVTGRPRMVKSIPKFLRLDGPPNGESQWFDHVLLKEILTFAKELFPKVGYAYTQTPTFLGGECGFILCSKNQETVFGDPVRRLTEAELQGFHMKYYNSDIHSCSFCLPQFSKTRLGL